MDSMKRKLRPRAKSTHDRATTTVSFASKRSASPDLIPRKKNQKNKGDPCIEEQQAVSAKRQRVGSTNGLRPILKNVQPHKEKESQNMPEIVLKNCKLTNTLFDMNKKVLEKNDSILSLTAQLSEVKVENVKLRNELKLKEAEAIIQFQEKVFGIKIQNLKLMTELEAKKIEIEELKGVIQNFENEKFCSDLIQFDDSNEGMLMNIFCA